MKQICPCCKKEFNPPPPLADGGDMGNLVACEHCNSTLKWIDGALKVVYESKPAPSILETAEEEEQEGSPLSQESPKADLGEEVAIAKNPESTREQAKGESGLVEESLSEENLPAEDVGLAKENLPEEEAGLLEESLPAVEGEVLAEELPAVEGLSEEDLLAERSLSGEEQINNQAEVLKKEEGETKDQVFNESAKGEEREGEEVVSAENLKEEEQWDDLPLQETDQDFSDVEKYGNAPASSEKGFLRYDLQISGLDSLEIEQEVLSVLEDPRFKWSAKEILRSQKKGVLEIKNLNPVKAMCLVSGLSFLSVQLRWKQYMALSAPTEGEEVGAEEENPLEADPTQ